MTWRRILHNANRVGPVNLHLHDCVNHLLEQARRGTSYPWNRTAFLTAMPLDLNGSEQVFNMMDSIATTAKGVQPCYVSVFVRTRRDLDGLVDPYLITRTWLQPRPWVLPAHYLHWTTTFQIFDKANPVEAAYMKWLHASTEYPYKTRLETWAAAHPLPLQWLPYVQPDIGAPRLLPFKPPLERAPIEDAQFGRAPKVSAPTLPT
jgi:hypothetical protein